MKILNLDKISPNSDRVLKIDGVDHAVKPVSAATFIFINEMVAKMEKGTPEEQLNALVDSIIKQVPTVSRDRLLDFDLATVNTIAAYVRGEDVEEQEQAVAQAAEQVAGK